MMRALRVNIQRRKVRTETKEQTKYSTSTSIDG